jgi:hypothetical protein
MASLGTAGLLAGIFPGSNTVLAPLLCPKDTTRSLVVKEVHQSGGKTSSRASLICQAPTGRLARVSGVTSFFTMLGAVATVLGTVTALGVGVRMIGRRSS